MFFDCSALVTGLVASVIMKWRPNERFTYGYVRAEVLAGFVNGLFLVFIAFFILSESVEVSILFHSLRTRLATTMILSWLSMLRENRGIF